ncbi:MAG: methyltransferase domain-containing protein, partial [Anaerolineae bacterium]|nr:methyltransferase domain-containing protein [Anaerolineae bacterium]
MGWVAAVIAVILIAAFLYWQLILAEGAYFGRHIVALLYDWSAHIYDRIKQFDPGYEQWFLARPLTNALFSFPNPQILDVATGTARLARTLFREVGFRGSIVGLDFSRKMLVQAAEKSKLWTDRIDLIWQDASVLPFPDDTFETVTCLEALEFMPDPDKVLSEMVRVLRPGGIFLVTNRIGKDTRWLPGRTQAQDTFETKLQNLRLEMVKTRPWQEDYDLVWAMKPGVCSPIEKRSLESILRCPLCSSRVTLEGKDYHCSHHHTIPTGADGII